MTEDFIEDTSEGKSGAPEDGGAPEDAAQEIIVAENTTVATPELIKKVRSFLYRRTLLCYVFLVAGGLVFTAVCVVLRILDKNVFASLHNLELVSGGVTVFLGIIGIISVLTTVGSGAPVEALATRSLFLRDRIIVEGDQADAVIYYSELSRVVRSRDVVYFIFRRGGVKGAREIFFVDERGFDKYAAKDFSGHRNIYEFLKAEGYAV